MRTTDTLFGGQNFLSVILQAFADADVVYGVWPESDPAERSILGHALSVIKGIPWLDAQYDVHRGGDFRAKTFTLMLDDFEDACEACRKYGDDREESAPQAPASDRPSRPPMTLERLSRPLLEEDLQYHPLSRHERHPIDDEKEALLVAARVEVSTPEDLQRRGAEMQRLKAALDRMTLPPKGKPPHKKGSRSLDDRSSLRPVGDSVFAALTTEERAHLARQMVLADGRRKELSGWHDSLGNHGMSASAGPTGKPTADQMRALLEDLGVFRTDRLCSAGEWGSVTEGLPCSRERLADLYGEVTGISDETLWGLKESAQAHDEARAVIEAMNRRRDALIREGWDVPRAHVASERWYPAPAKDTDPGAQTSLLP
ncbi:hypothetical protein [Methylobacterium sp. J-068]|uniref:hypothetical protein n=1 Tax=Methylobacterium sp. J-068 TaxID=2836649 RepID=UPI001FBBE5B9|nr:hypothetical protein [Methylobacterium sp. J-068]MCJ2035485.1 hypothetical protein [Methylobacterium sp. J-068]